MSLISDQMRELFDYIFGDNQTPLNPKKPRNLTEDDRLGWDDAMDQRQKSPLQPRTVQDVQRLIRNRNPLRWHGIQKDFKWVQKEMKKLGLNPEDARYIL